MQYKLLTGDLLQQL